MSGRYAGGPVGDLRLHPDLGREVSHATASGTLVLSAHEITGPAPDGP